MRIALVILIAALLAGCSTAETPTPTLSDEELAPPDAFVNSLRVGDTTYLYVRRTDDRSLFDVRVSGSRRTTEEGLLDAVSAAFGCTSLRVVGMNRTRTAGRVKGTACKPSQYIQ